jgi:predicted nuclease of restriction endonuclease-like (RecB) superfamily
VVDAHLVARNWLFGHYIAEFEQQGADRAEYGARVLGCLADRLKPMKIRGSSVTRLKLYRSFYRTFPIGPTLPDQSGNLITETSGKSPTASDLLASGVLQMQPTLPADLLSRFPVGWSHYVELLTIDSPDERRFYEIEAAANQWSVRELQRQIASSLYERLALSRDKEEIRRLATEGQVVEKAADLIKNPLVLEFLGLDERPHYTEDELESAIIDQLESFLLELGKGFLFEARQKRFTFDNDHFFVDLVFYNRLLRCYVLIDLKRDKLTHQDLGQMQMYVNYFDRHIKLPDELPTIGIVLCHHKNDALVELTLPQDANIFASKYQLYLPSKEELKARLEQITHDLEGE